MTGTAPDPATLLAEAKARENALRDVLDVISRSRDDEAPVFDAILKSAVELCDAQAGRLGLVNEARTHTTTMAVHGPNAGTFQVGETYALDGPYAAQQAVREGRTITIDDLRETRRYSDRDPLVAKMVDHDGARSMVVVPLVQAGTGIGLIALNRTQIKPFTPDEIALVKTFAAQAVIAIENVRQFREVQTRLEREAASREILEVISQSRDDEHPVFRTILQKAVELCSADVAGLNLLNADRTHLDLIEVYGAQSGRFDPGNYETDMQEPDNNMVTCVAEARTIAVANLADTDGYRSGMNEQRVALVDELGVRSWLAVPLLQNGIAIGCFGLFRTEIAPFSSDEIALVETFAAQAVIAIENVRQYRALEIRTEEVQALNALLEERVEDQVGEIERMRKLKSFLPAAVADAVVTSGNEKMLSSHRALIATLFCDMRGFTAFCETAEPEESIEVLQTYHEEMGDLISAHGGGVDKRMGDGIMVIFNDPLPVDDPAGDAVRLAIAMRDRMAALVAKWKKLGHRLGFGVGISLGYATVGMVGSAGRFDYTANGTAVNLAARLCDHAKDGEILVSPRAWIAVEDDFSGEDVGEMAFKGLNAPVMVTRVLGQINPA